LNYAIQPRNTPTAAGIQVSPSIIPGPLDLEYAEAIPTNVVAGTDRVFNVQRIKFVRILQK